MAKAQHRLHSWNEDPASGVRRSAPLPRRRTRRRVKGPPRAALASLAALLMLSVWLWSRPSASISVKRLPLSAAGPAAQPAAPAAQIKPTVELELSAWPREARLLLDGAALPANPYRGRVPADDGLHLLRVVAVGLQAQELAITLDRDRSLKLTLSRPTSARGRARRSDSRELAGPVSPLLLAPPQRARVIYEEDLYP